MPGTLHVIHDLAPGGAQTQLRLMALAAAARGEPVTVATLRRPVGETPALRAGGVAVEWIGRRFRVDPIAARRLRRLVVSTGANVVQTWDTPSARLYCLAMAGRRRPRWLHTLRETTPAQVAGEPWLGRLLRSADGVVATGPEVARRARRLGVLPNRLHTVPNAYDPAAVCPPGDRAAARAELARLGIGVGDETPVVAAVARLDEPSRVVEIAWAADLLRAVRPGLRLLVVGDGPARRACERFARLATEPGTVVFLGAQQAWPRVLAAADVAWCATDRSAAPTPLVEALAAGVPVVACTAPGRERLAGSVPGLGALVRWDDRAAWARETDRLIGTPPDSAVGEKTSHSDEGPGLAQYALGGVARLHAAALAG